MTLIACLLFDLDLPDVFRTFARNFENRYENDQTSCEGSPNFLRQDGAPGDTAGSAMKRSVWTAPAVERAAATLLASLPATYRPAVDFQLLTRESGSVRHDLPIWVSTPGTLRWSEAHGPVQRTDVPGVQGAFVLSNVLAVDECEQILRLSEAMGYTGDAP